MRSWKVIWIIGRGTVIRENGGAMRNLGSGGFLSGSVPENHGLLPVDQNPVVQVIPHAARQGHALAIPPQPQQILRQVEMLHPHYLLLDDRPLVQVARDVM